MTEATEEEHQRLMSVRHDRFAAIQDEDLERILARMKAVLVSTLRAGIDEIGRLPSEGTNNGGLIVFEWPSRRAALTFGVIPAEGAIC
jgi:hypothetical protein